MMLSPAAKHFEGATALDMKWIFRPWNPQVNDRRDDSEKFDVEDIVECALREALQNVLDSGSRVLRIRFVRIPRDVLARAIGTDEIEERVRTCRREGYGLEADTDGLVRCMVIEDEGCGIGGDYTRTPRYHEVPEGFQSYMRGTGNSSKSECQDGSKGEGRTAILRSSRLGAVVIETRRKYKPEAATPEAVGGDTLVFGLCRIDFHEFRGEDYADEGRFMLRTDPLNDPRAVMDPLLPRVGEEGRDVMRALGLARPEGVNGTTQVYPSVREEFTFGSVATDLILRHFIAILRGLKVWLQDEDGAVLEIDASNVAALAADPAFGGCEEHGALVEGTRVLIEAMGRAEDVGDVKERIAEHGFAEEFLLDRRADLKAGKPVCVSGHYHIRKRRGGGQEASSGRLKFGMLLDRRVSGGMNVLVRSGNVVISRDAAPGVITMAVSSDDAVGKMLRAGEDTSHTKWIPARMKERGWPGGASVSITMDFKHGAVRLYHRLAGLERETEDEALASLFGMPDPSARPSVKGQQDGFPPQPEPAPRPEPRPGPEPEPEPGPGNGACFAVARLEPGADGRWGVSLAHTSAGLDRHAEEGPARRYVALAYAQSEGSRSTWSQHSPADFSAHDFSFGCEGCSVEVVEPNVIAIDVDDADFRLDMRGRLHADRMLRVAEVTPVDN